MAVRPPSAAITAPVMKLARSEARNATTSASSSARAARFSSVVLPNASVRSGATRRCRRGRARPR